MQASSRFPETGTKSRIKCVCGFHPYGPGVENLEIIGKSEPLTPNPPSV